MQQVKMFFTILCLTFVITNPVHGKIVVALRKANQVKKNTFPPKSCGLKTLNTTTLPYLKTANKNKSRIILSKESMTSLELLAKAFYTKFKKPIVILSSWRSLAEAKKIRARFNNHYQATSPLKSGKARSHRSGMAIDILLDKHTKVCTKSKKFMAAYKKKYQKVYSRKRNTRGITYQQWKWIVSKEKKHGWKVLSPLFFRRMKKAKASIFHFCAMEGWHFTYIKGKRQPVCNK